MEKVTIGIEQTSNLPCVKVLYILYLQGAIDKFAALGETDYETPFSFMYISTL